MDTAACTVLLVDDEEANLALLETVLRPRGYRSLVRVSDPRRAVAAFQASRPDLVLLDLHMPHRSGWEVLADLRALVPEGEFLPVLVLTADVTPEARERALAGGAHDFVLKPFDRVEVLLRVRNLLRTRLLYAEQRRAREAAERVAARDRLLADVSRLLGGSFDTDTALRQLAHRLAPGYADGCAVHLRAPEGPVRAAAAGCCGTGAPPAEAPPAVPRLLEPGGAAPWLGEWAWASGAQAPLAAGGAPAGWLTLGRGPGAAPLDAEDLALTAEVGRRAALALENARLFRTAQDALEAREQVLAIVAHDLRGPLTAVRFDVEMLRLDPVLPLSPEDAGTLARVERAVARMDGLIEDLLDVSRMNRSALAVDRAPRDMNALLEEAAAEMRSLVEGQGVRFEVRGSPGLPALDVDAERLLQALSNLVGNAAKFAAYGGRVGMGWEVAGGELLVAVSDDGPGIAPERLQHIFGTFWQARHADRRGLGLGLSIARGIVEAHGGRIWVESEVGRGSTFFIALPVR